MKNLRKNQKGFFLLPTRTLTKKARKITAEQYKEAKRILSVYVEPGGLCAMTSNNNNKYRHHFFIKVQVYCIGTSDKTIP